MDEYSTSGNSGADSSVTVGISNTNISTAPTASPEQLSEPEYVFKNKRKLTGGYLY